MGNKVRIERICEFCGKTFIAKTCKTRFCCKACNDKYYKELIRSDRYNAVTKEVKEEKKKRIRLAVDELEVIQAREFISLKQPLQMDYRKATEQGCPLLPKALSAFRVLPVSREIVPCRSGFL